MGWTILSGILVVVLGVISYNMLQIFVLSSKKVNKYIVYVLPVIALVLPVWWVLSISWKASIFFNIYLFVVTILWAVDVARTDMKQKKITKKSHVSIRPKAKPNRAKLNNKK